MTNGENVGEFIKLVKALPLGGNSYSGRSGQLLYEDFFILVCRTPRAFIEDFCKELRREHKPVVLLTCIWAKAQVGEERQPNVVEAAKRVLGFLRNEAITADTLKNLLRDRRASILDSEYFEVDYGDDEEEGYSYDEQDFAKAAELLLSHLVG